MRYCADVAADLGLSVNAGFLPRECCDSCHDDASAGFDDLVWLDDDTQVCCAILRLVEDRKPPLSGTAPKP